ncbi:MAG: response regulator [bacterium]|nr:response regulator [bacterium]
MLENKQKRILLVEDEALVRLAEKKNLEQFGYSVITASTGEEAIDTFKTNDDINLILMDIYLGKGIDGAEAAEIILKKYNIPIIFLSDRAEPEIIKKTTKIDSYGYVPKNSDRSILDASIKMALKLFIERQRIKKYQEKIAFANEELKKSQDAQEAILSTTDILLAYMDREFNFISVNKAYADAGNRTQKDFPGKNHFDLYPHAENEAIFGRVVKTGEKKIFIARPFEHPDQPERGTTYWDWSIIPIKDSSGSVQSLVLSLLDVTERKKGEIALHTSLRENKILLRELQHRAKNSFSMIYSMIHLAADSDVSEETKLTLEDIAARIKAVSNMYDLLYSSNSVSEIKIHEYFELLSSSLPIISKKLTINTMFDALTVPVKTAIPIGIIVTELLTNSAKYAYPGNKKGTISFSLKKTKQSASIEVIDNGIGLPDAFDISTIDSMGLMLVNMLVEQIKGSFKIESNNGTSCFLKFPLEKNTSK